MSDIFFTADEHYGHRNAMTGWAGREGSTKARPWSTLEEMTEGLIERHNSVVKNRGDLVYHLGDMFWRTFGLPNAMDVMYRLNGQHFYVLGNHEEIMESFDGRELRKRFVWVKDRAKIRPRKELPSIILDHYAGRVWNGSHKGNYQLYGHSHGAIPNFGRSMDVGVDCNSYAPISLDEVVSILNDRPTELQFTPRV